MESNYQYEIEVLRGRIDGLVNIVMSQIDNIRLLRKELDNLSGIIMEKDVKINELSKQLLKEQPIMEGEKK